MSLYDQNTCSAIFIYNKVVQKRYVTLCFKMLPFPQAPDEEKTSNVNVSQTYLSTKLLSMQS